MTDNLADMRRVYAQSSLDEGSVGSDPFPLFAQWLAAARDAGEPEANAMVLATVDQHGMPSARTVLLKGLDANGLVFYTNYESRKGRDIAANPAVALVFTWASLERQVRITGLATQVSEAVSDAYFASRPVGSQIGAAASPQSEPVPNRAWLEKRFAQMAARDEPIGRPANWGGYCVEPRMFEFWQGRPDRLHDRIRFDRLDHEWDAVRLAP